MKRNWPALLAMALLIVGWVRLEGCAASKEHIVTEIPKHTVVRLMDTAKFKETFGLTDEAFEELMKKDPPHFDIHGNIIFQMDDIYPWMHKHYYKNPTPEGGSESQRAD